MDSIQLLKVVKKLPEHTPTLSSLEEQLGVGPGQGRAWYPSQKIHWMRWLAEYQTEGPYGRIVRKRSDARLIYNRLMCPPMIFWLPEALQCDDGSLQAAFDAALSAPANGASQAAAIRRVLPWTAVFEKITMHKGLQEILRS